MTQHALLLGLTAETSLHAGASTANHVIDLPIMREHNTGWPVVFGSAVKGALRARAETAKMERQRLFTLFGPDTENASDHAGSLLVADARLLLLPVRSLTTQFRYVTSPDLLRRWQRDQARAGLPVTPVEIEQPAADSAIVGPGCNISDLFLEEYVYQCDGSQDLSALISALAGLSDRTEAELAAKLTIVSDDQFSLLCRAAIPVNAHIAINNETKTVKPGALWYEESLPSETIMYSVIAAQDSRNKKSVDKSAEELLDMFSTDLFGSHPYLQLGGNETTGMGWCKVQVQRRGVV